MMCALSESSIVEPRSRRRTLTSEIALAVSCETVVTVYQSGEIRRHAAFLPLYTLYIAHDSSLIRGKGRSTMSKKDHDHADHRDLDWRGRLNPNCVTYGE